MKKEIYINMGGIMKEKVDFNNLPKHIAIIMDGNRRWARQKGLDPKLGHKEGVKALENIALYANEIGLKYLTVYAFSTENWKRAEDEVGALMILLQTYLERFSKKADLENIKIVVLGDITVLNNALRKEIEEAVEKTKNNTGLVLNIAFNYGGRAELVRATKQIAEKVKNGEMNLEDITEDTITNSLYTAGEPDPDLVIRTGGELRTSNFLPWQIVYSEYYFTQKYWPDFDGEALLEAIEEFQKRNRRFGAK